MTEHRARGFGFFLKLFLILAIVGTGLAGGSAAFLFWHFSRDLPEIITVADYHPIGVSRVLAQPPRSDADAAPAAKGSALRPTAPQEHLVGEFVGKERRYLIPYDKMPDILIKSFISAEDDTFFEHGGVNFSSIIRASIANFRAGHVVQGGSTITQQVAKSLLLTREKSFDRKIKELILSNRMEKNLTKQQILYLYLNQIYLGHGAYGVQAASRAYFNKDVGSLTIAEAAMLAGMPQAPSLYSPLLNPKKAKERQLYVLRRLMENKYISPAQMSEASSTPLKVFEEDDHSVHLGQYYLEHVRRHLIEKYGEKALYEDGLTVTIPTSLELMASARKSLRDGLEQVDKRGGYRGAIKKLKTQSEMEKFLKDERLELIARRAHFQVLLSDGKLDSTQAMYMSGIKSEAGLLEPGETYEAVVTSVDDARKLAGVMVGGARAELPLKNMLWARKNGIDPKAPSKVVEKGDVILIRVVSASEKEGVIVSLEQKPQVQGALFSMDVQTGQVLAMEGGYDFSDSEFNRAAQAQRQPGSSFKPIIFAAAIEKGYTPASIIVDSPIVYSNGDQGKWKPANFEEKFYGDTTFRYALIKSRNVPTIKIVQSIQIPYLIDYAHRIGMNSQFNSDLSISLGSTTASLMDMTRVYALFPRLGRRVTPIFITKVVDRDGKVLEENKPQPLPPPERMIAQLQPQITAEGDAPAPAPEPSATPGARVLSSLPKYPPENDPDQLMDPRVAYVMTHLMKEVVSYGTGHEAKQLGRAAAGKTGTTNDYLDAWFMGFTPHVVTGAWVGFDNQKSIGHGETGARAALPIWLEFMREAVKPYPTEGDFAIPPGVVFASIDPVTGKLAASNSSRAIREAFIEGTQPTERSDAKNSSQDIQGDFFKEDIE